MFAYCRWICYNLQKGYIWICKGGCIYGKKQGNYGIRYTITVSSDDFNDYICITDMAGAKSEKSRAADVIRNWLRNRITLEFLGT